MNKKIEDYLCYYIGQEVEFGYEGRKAVGKLVGLDVRFGYQVFDPRSAVVPYKFCKIELISLRLRPLSDITEKEMGELHLLWFGESSRDIYTATFNEVKFKPMELKRRTLHGSGIGYSAFDKNGKHIQTGTLSLSRLNSEQFHYLLKQGFDFFGLIEAGLAVDKTKEGK